MSKSSKFELATLQEQVGDQDCGLFAVAMVVSPLFHVEVPDIVFNQSQMRPHLLKCFKNNEFTMFPLTSYHNVVHNNIV